MDWRPMPIGERLYQPRSGAVSCERLLNLYAERNEKGAAYPVTLYGTPGLALWATMATVGCRGLYRFGSDIFAVYGQKLYAVDIATKAATELGDIDGAGMVRMTDNGVHVAIATSGKLYAANRDELLHIGDNFATVAAQDGYVILVKRGTQEFFIAGPDDLTVINALDFSTADAFPDNLVGGISDHRRLFLVGQETTEGWENTGNAAFPFERTSGAFMEVGGVSPGSICKHGGMVYWLDNHLNVRRAAGFQSEVISPPGIVGLIAEATGPESSEAFIYAQGGHAFYVLTFGDLTIAYDITTGLWHERCSYGLERWRAQGYTKAGADTHLVGDCQSGKIYELDLESYDEDGEALEWATQFPPVSAGARAVDFAELFLDAEMGVGLVEGQGEDPQAQLDWSEDDGRTWVGAMRASLGEIGQYRQRATYARLGRGRNRTFRISGSDPVKRVILGAQARFEVSQ